MSTVIGLAGSLREGSYNRALLRAASALAPDGLSIEIGTIGGIPLYDGDRERESGIPEPVSELKQRLAEADGLLLVTPEYNNSIPGVFKNAIDWLSRPPKDTRRVFGGKPVGLIGATPGPGGTRLAQLAWLPVLRTLGTRPWFDKQLNVARAKRVFDDEGRLVDDEIRERLVAFLEGFSAFVSAV